jgi:serine/threonine protein kinase
MPLFVPNSPRRRDEVMGRYEIVRPLAVGGMAQLHLARFRSIEGFEKLAVVKRLRPEHAQSSEMVDMFLGEARLLANMQHPNIVHVYDVGSESGSFYFAMEYLQGQDLRHVLRKAGKLPLEHALFIVASALSGLHYMHERRGPDGVPLGIVHRDVSPANIFVTYEGTPKILDLGIAKVESSHNTQAGVLKGKVRYMAPEQVAGKKIDRRTDVFAAGIILWELTVGRRLFDGRDIAVLLQIANLEVEAPTTSCPDYPRELERITMKALDRDPSKRYQTAREMQQDLEAFAREARLTVSAASLEAFMGQAFDPELKALNAVLRADNVLSTAHFAEARTSESVSKSGIVSGSRSTVGATKALAPSLPSRTRALLAGGAGLVALLLAVGTARLIAHTSTPAPVTATTAQAAPATSETVLSAPTRPSGTDEAVKPAAEEVPGEPTASAVPRASGTRPRAGVWSAPPRNASTAEEVHTATASCNPPYTVDTNGIEHFKPGCL